MHEESFLNIEIIKRMNKGYSFEEAVEELKNKFPYSKEILDNKLGIQGKTTIMSFDLLSSLEDFMELVFLNESEALINRQLGKLAYLWEIERK